jgi:hypothetical protein
VQIGQLYRQLESLFDCFLEEEDSDDEDSEGSSVGDDDIVSPPRSVASIDSI